MKKNINKDIHDLILAGKSLDEGGIDYAAKILTQTFGKQEAEVIISKLKEELESKPFTITRRATAKQLLNILQHENPQITALILSYIESEKSSEILQNLPTDLQLDVAKRISAMGKVDQEFIEEIEMFLADRMSNFTRSEDVEAGGNKQLAQILNRVDRATERNILEYFYLLDPSVAEDIKQHLFVFDDIAETLSTAAISKVISQVPNRVLALALKHTYPGVPEAIFAAMSSRQKDLVLEEQEMAGQQSLKEIEKAQKHIVEVVRELEAKGEITISRADDILV